LEGYHAAIGNREIACVKQLSNLPKSPTTLCGSGTYQPTKERKLKALHYYLDLLKFLLPSDPSISSAHLWHSDLHVANIFVDPSEPIKIVGLIDWQPTELSPLYFHARQPHIIDYDGPPVYGLDRPQPSKGLAKLEGDAKKRAETLYLQQSLCSLYNTLTYHYNTRLHNALQFQQTTSYLLLLLARNLLVDGEATYLSQVVELESILNTLLGAKNSSYPIFISAKEHKEIEAEVEGVVRGMGAMRSIRESLGEQFPEHGIVRPDQYEESLNALSQMKEQVIENFVKTEHERERWRKVWPFET
jgi:hypothetical protein